jgi:hypothetical protein
MVRKSFVMYLLVSSAPRQGFGGVTSRDVPLRYLAAYRQACRLMIVEMTSFLDLPLAQCYWAAIHHTSMYYCYTSVQIECLLA